MRSQRQQKQQQGERGTPPLPSARELVSAGLLVHKGGDEPRFNFGGFTYGPCLKPVPAAGVEAVQETGSN